MHLDIDLMVVQLGKHLAYSHISTAWIFRNQGSRSFDMLRYSRYFSIRNGRIFYRYSQQLHRALLRKSRTL